MSKGHFVFEIGIIRALALFVVLLGAGFVAGAVWAKVDSRKSNSQRRTI